MLFADGDALTGGGIVGGLMTLAGFLYVLFDRYKNATARRAARKAIADAATDAKAVLTDAARLKNEEEEIRVGELARKAVEEAYRDAIEVRKTTHDADIRAVRAEIKRATDRIQGLEERDKKCKEDMAAQALEITTLKRQNAEQAGEITRQAGEITSLKAEISTLESKLRSCGSLPQK